MFPWEVVGFRVGASLGSNRIYGHLWQHSQMPIFLTMVREGSTWLDRAGLSANKNFLGEGMSTEGKLGNSGVGQPEISGENCIALC